MNERVRRILVAVENDEKLTRLLEWYDDDAFDNIESLLDDGLTDEEIIEFIQRLDKSAIYVEEGYVYNYIQSVAVFTEETFTTFLHDKVGACVVVKLSTGKVVVI